MLIDHYCNQSCEVLCTHAEIRGQNKAIRRPVGGATSTRRPAPLRCSRPVNQAAVISNGNDADGAHKCTVVLHLVETVALHTNTDSAPLETQHCGDWILNESQAATTSNQSDSISGFRRIAELEMGDKRLVSQIVLSSKIAATNLQRLSFP